MRGTVAKRLRRDAGELATNFDDDYALGNRANIVHAPKSFMWIYKHLKKLYKQEKGEK